MRASVHVTISQKIGVVDFFNSLVNIGSFGSVKVCVLCIRHVNQNNYF